MTRATPDEETGRDAGVIAGNGKTRNDSHYPAQPGSELGHDRSTRQPVLSLIQARSKLTEDIEGMAVDDSDKGRSGTIRC